LSDYSPETKRHARAAQRAAEWTRSACGGLGIEGNPRYLYAAFFFDLLAKAAEGIADDPPRRDFRTATRVRPSLATTQYIETDEPSDRVVLATAETADSAQRYLAAHLRACERMQGARNARHELEARQRADEATGHAHSASRALEQLSARMLELAKAEARHSSSEWPRGRPRLTDVSASAQAVLFLGGLRNRDLEVVLRGTRLEDAALADERFTGASESFRQFGLVMATWTPSSEPDLSL
jgi:hypothetical protein